MALVRESTGTSAAATGTSVTAGTPSGLTSGDLIIMIVGAGEDNALTYPSGWTVEAELAEALGGDRRIAALSYEYTGTTPSFETICGSSIDLFAVAMRYSGHHPDNPIRFVDTNSQTNAGTTVDSNDGTSPHAKTGDDAIHAFVQKDGGGVHTAITVPSGTTEIASEVSFGVTSFGVAVEDCTGQPGQGTWTVTGADAGDDGTALTLVLCADTEVSAHVLVNDTGSPGHAAADIKTALDAYGVTATYKDIDDAVDTAPELAVATPELSGATALQKYENNADICYFMVSADWNSTSVFAGGSPASSNFDDEIEVEANANDGPDWWPSQSGASVGDAVAVLTGTSNYSWRGRTAFMATGKDDIARNVTSNQVCVIGIPEGDTTYADGSANSPQSAIAVTALSDTAYTEQDGYNLIGDIAVATAKVASGVDIAAATGTLTLAGQSATVDAGEATTAANLGTLTLAGQQATVSAGAANVTVNASTGALTLAGQQATVDAGEATTAAATGTLTLAGQQATVTAGETTVSAATGTLTLAGQQASVAAGTIVPANPGTLTLAGQQATVDPGAATVAAATGTLTLAGQQATVNAGSVVAANLGTLTLAGQQATAVAGTVTITTAAGTLTLAGNGASVTALGGPQTVTAAIGTLVLVGLGAAVVNINSTATPAVRVYAVPAENRVFAVPPEIRVYAV